MLKRSESRHFTINDCEILLPKVFLRHLTKECTGIKLIDQTHGSRGSMSVEEKEFFKEITLRICGHLDVEDGLAACLEYLAHYMPADAIYLQKNEHELKAMPTKPHTKSGHPNEWIP